MYSLGRSPRLTNNYLGLISLLFFLSKTFSYFLVPGGSSILSFSQKTRTLVTLLSSALLKCVHIMSQTIEGQTRQKVVLVGPTFWNYISAEGRGRLFCSEFCLLWVLIMLQNYLGARPRDNRKRERIQQEIFLIVSKQYDFLFCNLSQF